VNQFIRWHSADRSYIHAVYDVFKIHYSMSTENYIKPTAVQLIQSKK